MGYDNVDIAAAGPRHLGGQRPDYCGEDVSDQAFALWMSCVRNVARRDRDVRAGVWDITRGPAMARQGQNFVFCGFGQIARILRRKISGFDLGRILVYDPFLDEAAIKAAGAEKVNWETALQEGDYFSIHTAAERPDPGHVQCRGFPHDEKHRHPGQHFPRADRG